MGILFIDAGGHMPMCGHSTIGCVTAMLESGRVPITGEVTEVNIDTPAGLVRTRATVENGSVTIAYRRTRKEMPASCSARGRSRFPV